jgi:hypothetical protein
MGHVTKYQQIQCSFTASDGFSVPAVVYEVELVDILSPPGVKAPPQRS